ncbi:hypothetical protein [Agrobacterium vitis]|uniref:hypothetical protein n=1 Tax=Agrobacterium vitis TaxID=373 RepID=UPI000871FCD4|nr:hypothetical protein [Agrobacterium vitis]MCE6075513.1 hypothetical protein [Agrobacterium vitis]MCM2451726.1 hypothetical protein [Agrobacterium vitis]MCM2467991.1 hypothetical protein [Agrobacterium vitis]MUO72571.1 hypothetical protein [Agrobacterium vitis]MUO86504.1 hypothetical protein [Agrobacterium vitis]
MINRFTLILNEAVVIWGCLTAGAAAMDRYYCAVDDAQLKLSIEAAFKEEPSWPLANLRGVMVFKPGQGADRTVTGAVRLAMADMVQARRDDRSFQLRTSSTSGDGGESMSVDIVLNASMQGEDINRFAGSYAVMVRPQGNTNPAAAVERDGALNCKRF